MSRYLHTHQLAPDDLDEEDSDLDGFVASDEEFIDDEEAGHDYSSEIQKIFGYDRTRYVRTYVCACVHTYVPMSMSTCVRLHYHL